jgi:predicted transcriptional regulator
LTDITGKASSSSSLHTREAPVSQASPTIPPGYQAQEAESTERRIFKNEFDRPKRRAKSEIFCDILMVIDRGTTRPTRILQRANLTWNQQLMYLDILLRNGFITREVRGRIVSYHLTPKGKSVVELSSRLRELISALDFASFVDDPRLETLKQPAVGSIRNNASWKGDRDEDSEGEPRPLDIFTLTGKHILLEVDPSRNYELAVTRIVDDFVSKGQAAYLFSWKGSPIYENLLGRDDLNFCTMESGVSFRKEGKKEVIIPENDHAVLLDEFSRATKSGLDAGALIIFDSISDLIMSESLPNAYRVLMGINGLASGTGTTTVSILRQHAHDEKVESVIKGIYACHLLYGQSGLQLIRSR